MAVNKVLKDCVFSYYLNRKVVEIIAIQFLRIVFFRII